MTAQGFNSSNPDMCEKTVVPVSSITGKHGATLLMYTV